MGKRYYPNMNLVRYIMAFGVLVAHFNTLGNHNIPFPISSFDSVGGFFALSGFLMYPSFCKARNTKVYVLHRALRILPPYIFTVLICALGLAFISTLPMSAYFASSEFWKYLGANLSFLNWLQPSLPGVFDGAQYITPAVDGSLWTMKIEWCLYLSVPLFMWCITRFHIKRYAAIVCIMIFSCAYRILFTELYDSTGKEIYNILGRQFFGQLSFFYSGMLIYFIKDCFFDHHKLIILLITPAYLLSTHIPYGDILIAPFTLSSLAISFSMIGINLMPGGGKINLSYNIYLLHFPIIQLMIHWRLNDLNEWMLIAIVTCATVIVSAISYFFVEKPVYKLKSKIK